MPIVQRGRGGVLSLTTRLTRIPALAGVYISFICRMFNLNMSSSEALVGVTIIAEKECMTRDRGPLNNVLHNYKKAGGVKLAVVRTVSPFSRVQNMNENGLATRKRFKV